MVMVPERLESTAPSRLTTLQFTILSPEEANENL